MLLPKTWIPVKLGTKHENSSILSIFYKTMLLNPSNFCICLNSKWKTEIKTKTPFVFQPLLCQYYQWLEKEKLPGLDQRFALTRMRLKVIEVTRELMRWLNPISSEANKCMHYIRSSSGISGARPVLTGVGISLSKREGRSILKRNFPLH